MISCFFVGCMSAERASVKDQAIDSNAAIIKNQQIEEIIQKSQVQPVGSVSKYQAIGMASYFHLLAEEQIVLKQFQYASSLYELAFKFHQDPYYSLRHVESLSLGQNIKEAKTHLKRYLLMFPADKDLKEVQKGNFAKGSKVNTRT